MIKKLKWFPWRIYNFFNLNINGVGVVVIKDYRVLLIKKKLGIVMGWQIPGGGLKGDKDIEEVANEELYEETGIVVSELESLMTKNFFDVHNVVTFYLGHNIVGSTVPKVHDSIEIAEAKWIPVDEAMEMLIKEHKPVLAKAMEKLDVF